MSDGEISIPRPEQVLCQFTSNVLDSRDCFSCVSMWAIASPSGRYIYLNPPNSILLVDTVDQIECKYTFSTCREEKHGPVWKLHPLSDDKMFGVFLAWESGRISPIIRHLTFDLSVPVMTMSDPAPFSILDYYYESSFAYDDCVGVFLWRKNAESVYEDRCIIFKYENGTWTETANILVGQRSGNYNVRSYSTWPTLYRGSVYSFLSGRYLGENLENYLKELNNIHKIDLTTYSSSVFKARNDLRCLGVREKLLQNKLPYSSGMSKSHSWRGADLFISWGIRYIPYGKYTTYPQRYQMHYLGTFSLSTLYWRPICVEWMTPALYTFPLRALVSDDHVMILLHLKKAVDNEDDLNVIVQTWHAPIPMGTPLRLSRLAQLAVLTKLRSSGFISGFGGDAEQILKSIKLSFN